MPRLIACLIPAAALLLVAATDAPGKKEPADPNKVRCKSQVETGSLVRKAKVCRTEAEWRRLSETGRERTQEMQTIYGAGGAH